MILLVTGARALADTPAALAWACALVANAVHGVARVVTGDAMGADDVARGLAFENGAALEVWHTDGRRVEFDRQAHHAVTRWKADGRRAPLARNAAMVAHVAATYPPQDVRVLALLAGWSRTHGTHMTLGLARRAGLAVEEHTCPAEHGPRGGR